MHRRQLPTAPWEDIAVDFLGPLPDGQWLFVVVDYYSRFMEVVEMNRITAKDTIGELATIFGRFGIPKTMRADNGPQLRAECEELQSYCQELGVELVNTTPYWPQANGEVERQNRTILKRLRIAHELGKDWRRELRAFLLSYHATNHTVTGRSPSELMFGRRIRSKLPEVPRLALYDGEERDRDKILKAKGKEYADLKRKAHPNVIAVGDKVIVKRAKKDHKLSTDFSPELFVVVERRGSEVTVKSLSTGKQFKRNVGHLKKTATENSTENEPSTADASWEATAEADDATKQNELSTSEVPNTEKSVKRKRSEPTRYRDFVPY